MSPATSLRAVADSSARRLARWGSRQAEQYSHGHDRPLGGYLTMLSGYLAGVGAVAVLGRLTGRRIPERIEPLDLVLLGVATHRLSRTLAKDPITSPLRAPFTRFEGLSAPSELSESVRGEGLQHSAGELLACPMCLAQWVASAFAAGLVFAPRPTRLAMATFSAVATSDFLQYVYALLQRKTQ